MIDSPNIPVWADPQWEDATAGAAAWTSLPVLDGDRHCSTCVIGLGGSGLTAIDELLSKGDDVIGVDGHDVGAGAAGRNGGFLLAGAYDFYHDAQRLHGAERTRAIYQATLEEIARIANATPHSVRFVGSRRLAASEWEIEDCRKQLNAMRADNWEAEWYEGDDGIGLTLPSDASFNPLVRCRALAEQVRSRGARLYAQSAVTELSSGRVVTAKGVIHCQRIIVAVDGKLEQILPELSDRVRTARLQMLATEPTVERIVPCPMYYREGYEYWQQLPNGSIALGGFRDQAMENEWTLDTKPANPIQRLLEQFLRDKLGVSAAITHRWAASAGYSNSGLPVLGQIRDRVWAIGGYSGTGNVIGALCGRAVVALALDGDAGPARLLVPLS
ncbi:MAG: FAD-binding oxidoreductase [Gemmatimonadaceae bacterium]